MTAIVLRNRFVFWFCTGIFLVSISAQVGLFFLLKKLACHYHSKAISLMNRTLRSIVLSLLFQLLFGFSCLEKFLSGVIY